jgi:hypothetical protein
VEFLWAFGYGLFVAIGYVASGTLHAVTWPNSEGLATWGSALFGRQTRPPASARNGMLILGLVLLAAWTSLFLLPLGARAILWIGATLAFASVIASQWIASSAVKVVYEGSFAGLALFSALFLEYALPTSDIQPATTLLAALALTVSYVTLVLNFVNQIFSRADWAGDVKVRQIRRHIFLMSYLALGMGIFLVIPLVASALP